MSEVGFVDIFEHPIACPGNSWPADPRLRKIGGIGCVDASKLIRPLSMKILRYGLGISVEEIETFVDLVDKDLKDRRIHWYGIT